MEPTPKQMSMFLCPSCGEYLPEARPTRKFHNSACRSRYWRKKRNMQMHAVIAQQYIAEMGSLLSDPSMVDEVREALMDVFRTCQDAVRHADARMWMEWHEFKH